jgi:hypothetical protein
MTGSAHHGFPMPLNFTNGISSNLPRISPNTGNKGEIMGIYKNFQKKMD